MDVSSKSLLESMLYRIPNLRFIYDLLDLETISSTHHIEQTNIVSHFENPKIIIVIGVVTHCLIIERSKKNTYHVVDICNEAIYMKCGRGEIYDICYDTLRMRAFMPEPLSKKIVFIDEYSSRNFGGILFTQYYKDGRTGFILGNCKYGSKDNYELVEEDSYQLVTKFLRTIEVNPNIK